MNETKLHIYNPIFSFLKRWWLLLPGPVGICLVLLARQSPEMTEKLYSSGIYPWMVRVWGGLTSLLPFSLIELLICLMILGVFALLFLVIRSLIKREKKTDAPPARIGLLIGRMAKLLSCILFAFIILCGLNYYRPEFPAFSGLDVRDSPVQELAALCSELAGRANELRAQMPEDENGVMRLETGYYATAREARASFGKLSEDYSVLPDLPINPKPVMNSWWMSLTQITGVFSPYTYEANVNIAAPDYTIPATICHELAHTRGFMREDEANFIGYLACEKSGDPQFTYSGVMLALVHSINRLYSVDYNAFCQVNDTLSDGVRRDFAYNNTYWEKHEGPVAAVSEAVNDTYLKVNNQQDGTQSYGRMVDLLLADYRARHAEG